MSSCQLNNFLLMRDQYLLNRQTAREDFKDSSYVVTMSPDITNYPEFTGVYSKGFGHTGTGGGISYKPEQSEYEKLVEGITFKDQQKIEQVCQVFVPNEKNQRRLVDVYCIFDKEIYGRFRSSYDISGAPSPTSAQAQAELLELYAMSLMRDVGFNLLSEYVTTLFLPPGATAYVDKIVTWMNDPYIKNNLNAPLDACGNITSTNLFRGKTGDLIGPHVSQFFFYAISYGQLIVNQTYDVYENSVFNNFNPNYWPNFNNDFVRTESNFLRLWNGFNITDPNENPDSNGGEQHEYNKRCITTLRDSALYIYRDQVWQPFYTVACILSTAPRTDAPGVLGIPIGFTVNPPNSRIGSKFIDLGLVDLYYLLMTVTKLAMDSTWLYKWSQLRLRPEEMAYQVHLKIKYGLGLDFSANLINNPILADVSNNNSGNYLLPQAYTVGSPCHPALPSGHATIAGAMSTIIKAWFNCDASMNAYESNYYAGIPSGYPPYLAIYPAAFESGYTGPNITLKVEHEIDKMASNCSIFRNIAGIHYRSDAETGLNIGEQVAIAVLQEWVNRYSADVIFKFKLRDGTKYKVSKSESGPFTVGPVYNPTTAIIDAALIAGSPSGGNDPEILFNPDNQSLS